MRSLYSDLDVLKPLWLYGDEFFKPRAVSVRSIAIVDGEPNIEVVAISSGLHYGPFNRRGRSNSDLSISNREPPVARHGWMNIYEVHQIDDRGAVASAEMIWPTMEQAELFRTAGCVACIKVTWIQGRGI